MLAEQCFRRNEDEHTNESTQIYFFSFIQFRPPPPPFCIHVEIPSLPSPPVPPPAAVLHPCGDPFPPVQFRPPPPFCIRVEILEMESLPAADFNLIGSGTSDPYVVYSVGALTYSTSVVEKTCNPRYQEKKHKRSGEFLVYNAQQKLFVDVYLGLCNEFFLVSSLV